MEHMKRLDLALPIRLSPRLSMRTDLHLARKAWHMFMGLFIVGLYMAGIPKVVGIVILSAVLTFDLAVEMARLRNPELNQKVMRLWGPLMRSSEADHVSGVPYYLMAAILTMAIFPKPIAALSILYLACGDPIASLVGIMYGDRSVRLPNGKSLIGTSAGVLVCTIVTFVFCQGYQLPPSTLFALSIFGGLAGGAAEL